MKIKTVLGMTLSLISTTIGADQAEGGLIHAGGLFTEAPAKNLEIIGGSPAFASSEKKLQQSVKVYDLRRMCLIKKQHEALDLKVKELLKALESSQYVYEGL